MTSIEDLKDRLDKIEAKQDELLAWMNQQKGGRKAFYALMGFSATIGGLLVKGADKLWP